MTETEGEEEKQRCEYIFDPDEGEVPAFAHSAITEEWRCPHIAEKEHNGKYLCIFHLPISEKDANDVQSRFVKCVSADGASVKRFVGGKFEGIALFNFVLGSNDNNPIDLRYATFENDFDLTGSTVSQPFFLTGADINGELKLPAVKFHALVFAQHIEVERGILCTDSRFYDSVNFRESKFDEHAKFRECVFQGETSFYGCEFNVDPNLPYGSQIAKANHRPQLVNFSEVTFSEGINLNSAEFNDILYFNGVTADGTVHLDDVELNGKSHSHWHIVPESDSVPEETREGNHVAEVGGEFTRLQISPDTVADEPCIISLQGATIKSGSFSQPDPTTAYYDFSGATLGEVQFEDMDSVVAWEHLIFNDTGFEGFNFIDYHSVLDESKYNLCTVRDPHDLFDEVALREKELTYLKARIGADAVRDHQSSAEFHIRELDNRRTRLKEQGDWLSYGAYLLYGFTSRYGEKPGRVLLVFTPLLLLSYWISNTAIVSGMLSNAFELLFAVLPPIFSGLLVLASYRYIGN
ncbi:pentapeptide repeat-containing protein [Halorubrum sp. Eb13]|uniref:pentapeptide repeat-containing protein n=1 Tax=Halorubrum sp. Eb13 TaxID=1383843 RepID=UPI00114006DD|nr:pentapeptide repeat-containing protein [Halorubrum sp. Eb13]